MGFQGFPKIPRKNGLQVIQTQSRRALGTAEFRTFSRMAHLNATPTPDKSRERHLRISLSCGSLRSKNLGRSTPDFLRDDGLTRHNAARGRSRGHSLAVIPHRSPVDLVATDGGGAFQDSSDLDIAPIVATAGESLLIIQCARYGTFGFQRDEQIKGRSAGRRLLLIEPELPSLPAIAKWCLSLLGTTHSGKFPIHDFRAMEIAFPPRFT